MNKKLRIVHVIGYFQPKLGYQEYYLALKQQELGHEVFVVTSDRNYPYLGYKETYEPTLGKRVIGAGTFSEKGITVLRLPCLFEYADQIILKDVAKTLIKLHPDIVHTHDEFSQPLIVSLLFKTVLRYRLISDCHADYMLQSNSKLRRFVWNFISLNPLYRSILKKADGFIAVSESARQWLSNEFGITYDEIKVISLGADKVLFFPNVTARKLIREELQIKENEFLIISAGKIIPSKDLDILLSASEPLINKYKNVKILLIGNGPKYYVDELKKQVQQLGITDHVLFRDFLDKTALPYYYNAADVGVWPGQDSITIIEAMATGLPIIVPRNYRNLHYLEYFNGFNFGKRDAAELKAHLEKLLTDAELRRTMSSRSRKLIEDKLSWEVITKMTMNFYKEKFKVH